MTHSYTTPEERAALKAAVEDQDRTILFSHLGTHARHFERVTSVDLSSEDAQQHRAHTHMGNSINLFNASAWMFVEVKALTC